MDCINDDLACPYVDTSGMDKTMDCKECPLNKKKDEDLLPDNDVQP